jgi:iron transport multicopper oxidase
MNPNHLTSAYSHIHGHKFQIVGRAADYTSDDPTLNPPLVEGQVNPVRRDTVQVPSMSSVTMRFIADNPGAWYVTHVLICMF